MRLDYLILFVLVTSIVACNKGEIDITAPTLTFISITPQPQRQMVCGVMEDGVITLNGGDILAFKVLFEDDQALSQYKIDIHNNFDCHGHGDGAFPGVSVPNTPNATADWALLEINNLNGSEMVIDKALTVPQNVTAGFYHFQVQVIDESGNDDPFADFIALRVFNPLDKIPPVLDVEIPSGNQSVVKGNTMRFKGKVTDNRSLSDGGNGVLYLTYTDTNTQNTFLTNMIFPFDSSVETEFLFDFNYTVPVTLTNGDYRFSIRVHDGVRNVGEAVHFLTSVSN